jgi:hypothetical protein
MANCRHEVVAGLMDDGLLPEQVLRARKASSAARVRWSEVPVIPYRGYLPWVLGARIFSGRESADNWSDRDVGYRMSGRRR